MKNRNLSFIVGLIFCTLTACNTQVITTPDDLDPIPSPTPDTILPTGVPSPTPDPPSVLTVCSQEPGSLFLYGDSSGVARNVRQAIYDGPLDIINYQVDPVILEQVPSFENGAAWLLPVEVAPGDLVIDAQGEWVTFEEGISYRPSGCTDLSCTLTHEGQEPVQMDAMVLQFQLLPGLTWSDGEPLTAADSEFSFGVYQHLFERFYPEILRITESYTAVDEQIVEWTGIPGYVGPIVPKFFSPLPSHQLNGLDRDTWLTSPLTNRTPMGWGPYTIMEWVDGDHITLDRNPYYFRADGGYPSFDHLVYRFFEDGETAMDALVIGECDLIDQNLLFEAHIPRLQAEQEAGNLKFSVLPGTSWELAAFGINSLDEERPDLFEAKQVRQAIAMCIDRHKIVNDRLYGYAPVLSSFVPSNHPLYQVGSPYDYDPDHAIELLASEGWIDHDVDPQTPLVSSGIPGIVDGSPFFFTYRVPSDGDRPRVAEMIAKDLAQCGFGVDLILGDWDTLMAPGPDGPLFGRRFDIAQFAWSFSLEPNCSLFTSGEVPGPYPEAPKGWGGANLSGYSSPEFDDTCLQATLALPDGEAYRQFHEGAQEIFAEDLPVVPLYQHFLLVALRPDMCSEGFTAFNHIETLAYGEFCD